MEVIAIISNWEKSGKNNLASFSLTPHYSNLFDDTEVGLDYIYEKIGVSKDTLINTENRFVIEKMRSIDDLFGETAKLLEQYIVKHILCESSFENVVLEYSFVTSKVEHLYDEILNIMGQIKNEFEGESDE